MICCKILQHILKFLNYEMLKLYINGLAVDSASVPQSINYYTNHNIGGRENSNSIHGNLDNISIESSDSLTDEINGALMNIAGNNLGPIFLKGISTSKLFICRPYQFLETLISINPKGSG